MKKWTEAALVRAIKTVAQTAVATIGTTAALSDVDWRLVLSASALAGLLSILTSIAGLPEVKTEYDADGETREDIETLDGEEGDEDDEEE